MSRVLLSWSSGKDSALALLRLLDSEGLEVVGLFTTFDQRTGVLNIQGTTADQCRLQAQLAGLPWIAVPLPQQKLPNSLYEQALSQALKESSLEFDTLAFGDLHLEEIRRYREDFCQRFGWKSLSPLWNLDSEVAAQQVIGSGIRAVVCSVDRTQLEESYCGRDFDQEFIDQLPSHTDVCGEKGEFHTFVYQAPFFSRPVSYSQEGFRRDDRWTYLNLNCK